MTDLYLLGSGIRSSTQFTLESIQAIEACKAVIVLHDDPEIVRFVARRCPKVIDAEEFYVGDGHRAEVYQRIASALLDLAQTNPPAGLLVHGHPLFLVSAAEYTIAQARERGIALSVLPGVSSFDTLMCDLELDFGYALQMFDASTLIREGHRPNPNVPLLVFQIATTLNDQITRGAIDSDVLAPLSVHLTRYYALDHKCEIVYSGTGLIERTHRVTSTIGAMSSVNGLELWRRPTLFVPAVGR